MILRPLAFGSGVVLGLLGVLALDSSRPLKPRKDWMDPANAPPAFPDVVVHAYDPYEKLPCCKQCGGGWLHPIHDVTGTVSIRPGPRSSQETVIPQCVMDGLLAEIPGSWFGEKGNEF